MSILWNGDQHQETTCSHLRRITLFPLLVLWPHVEVIFCISTGIIPLKSNHCSKRNFGKSLFLFPRGFEASNEGCHCSAVFNVNQNAQAWVTPSLSCLLSASTKARCENRDAPKSQVILSASLRRMWSTDLWEKSCIFNEDSAVKSLQQ